MKTLILIITVFSQIALANDLTKVVEFPFISINTYDSIIENTPSWDKNTIQRIEKYAPILEQIGNSLDVSPELLLSIAWAESHFNPNAVSFVGAKGIMQVKPLTQEYIFNKNKHNQTTRQLFTILLTKHQVHHEIVANLIAGSLYVKYLLNKYEGDLQKTVIAYNVGPTGTYRLINKNENLDNHRYFIKIQNNLKVVALQ